MRKRSERLSSSLPKVIKISKREGGIGTQVCLISFCHVQFVEKDVKTNDKSKAVSALQSLNKTMYVSRSVNYEDRQIGLSSAAGSFL